MKNFYLILFFIFAAGNIYIYQTIFESRVLEVSILEVGRGDAILVRTPNDKTILVDAGPNASILRALGTALPEWQRRIDIIALTSEKVAAVGGLTDVMNRYHVTTQTHFGTADIPYGTRFTLDTVSVDILYAGMLNISYDSASFAISSTTPKGMYISDGKIVAQIK